MLPTGQNSIKLFRLAGIQVYLNYLWFVVAVWMIFSRDREYSSLVWNALEYLSLFAIVLMHEFGHALACRQVGGYAKEIVLWPFGGVAYVQPPDRPGATLWSIAAGPLVNVALVPILGGLLALAGQQEWLAQFPDFQAYLKTIFTINLVLLVFNLMPIFPLDGGQILWTLLWFIFGKARALLFTTLLGMVAIPLFLIAAFFLFKSGWMVVMGVFILLMCWGGLKRARQMAKAEASARPVEFACPGCGARPPTGAYWHCAQCRQPFDPFATGALCPHCRMQYHVTICPACKQVHPFSSWMVPPPLVPPRI